MNVVTNELVAAVVLPLVGLLFGKGFAWWKRRAREKQDATYVKAVEAFEIGVQEAWTDLGRQWKAARDDGKFTGDEKQALRTRAIETAREVGRAQGIDVLKVIGTRGVALLLKKIVDRRKRGQA